VLNELNGFQFIFLPDKTAPLPLPIDLSFLKENTYRVKTKRSAIAFNEWSYAFGLLLATDAGIA
jgi:hypothetical protein